MKPNDTVTVYEDPLTEEKPEGRATLLRFLPVGTKQHLGIRNGRTLEQWEVHFEDDAEGHNVARQILV